ncbi:hypothetical protein A3J32_03135 [Candidatus Saccharibacteria bacterium RIFCSPLOWO2_02_FULL_46_7]|nr:MAG: hypothetical protein A3J32_03135 [Candidatus Saccharibacteria bacterium RIFCSPLOWO2_02_FULL_46_7]
MVGGEFTFEVSDYDEKTGLLNQRGLLKTLTQLESDVPGRFSLLIADLDRLKSVNDQFGHDAGDKYLFDAGTVLSTGVRTERLDLVAARIHGDEFAIVLPGVSDVEILELIRSRVEQKMDIEDIPASIGGRPHKDGEPIDVLLKDSDQMMFLKKRQRRQAAFEALPLPKKVAGWAGSKLLRYAGINPPRQ